MIRKRYRRIVLFFARILLGFAFWDLFLPRIGFGGRSKRTRSKRFRESAVAFRKLAVEMGGVLIKVGQFLSTRVDVLPKEFIDELSGLQDEVPAEDFADVRAVAEAEFGCSLEEKFAWIDPQPLAAASLGQVHRATLDRKDAQAAGNGEPVGNRVVLKVQRPDIENIIATDLAALNTVGRWLKRYRPIRKRADVPALLNEFTRILYEEIDYLAEGRNAETFAANFKSYSGVRVPGVIWTHTTRKALTLEDVYAIKITDYEAISAAGIDRAEVARRLLDTYLQQIFEDGFFHADPHPGNLFVTPLNGEGPQGEPLWDLTFVDFGMVGRVPANTKDALREMLIGVGTRDAARVVRSYQSLGLLLPDADVELLERAEARAFESFWGRSMSELQGISMDEIEEFTSEFRELIYTMPFQIPQDFIFLARAVGILSGMCTGLDPNFNVWLSLAPYAERLIAEEARGGREFWLGEIKILVQALLSVPAKMDKMLTKMERGDIAVRAPDVVRRIDRLATALRQIAGAIFFLAFFSAGVQLYLNASFLPAGIVFAAAGIVFLWVVYVGRRG